MQVKLCARCPYTPRDLADHYDSEAVLHLCATCDVEYGPRETPRRPTCQTMTINPTGSTDPTGFHVAPFAKESSASFATIAAARPSVQENASSVSLSAGNAIAVGYGDFELPEDSSREQMGRSWRSGFPNKEPAC